MATYQVRVNAWRSPAIEAPTGDYRLVAAMALALADASLPATVEVWCEELLPNYGPYTYHAEDDNFGNLVVRVG